MSSDSSSDSSSDFEPEVVVKEKSVRRSKRKGDVPSIEIEMTSYNSSPGGSRKLRESGRKHYHGKDSSKEVRESRKGELGESGRDELKREKRMLDSLDVGVKKSGDFKKNIGVNVLRPERSPRLSRSGNKKTSVKILNHSLRKSAVATEGENYRPKKEEKPSYQNNIISRGVISRLIEREKIILLTFVELFFATLFLIMVFRQFEVETTFSAQYQLISIIHTVPFSPILIKFGDIGGYDDYWGWLLEVLLPRIVTEVDTGGNPLPIDDMHYIDQHYNRLYGGIMYWNVRREERECFQRKLPEGFYPHCYYIDQDYNDYYFHHADYLEGNHSLTDDYEFIDAATFQADIDLSVSDYVWLPREWGYANINNITKFLRDSHWLDRRSQRFTVGMIFYNDYSITQAYIPVMFHAQGNVRQRETTRNIPTNLYNFNRTSVIIRSVIEIIVFLGIFILFVIHYNRFRTQHYYRLYLSRLQNRFTYTGKTFVIITMNQFLLLVQFVIWIVLNYYLEYKVNFIPEDELTVTKYGEIKNALDVLFSLQDWYILVVNVNTMTICLRIMYVCQRFPVFDLFMQSTRRAFVEVMMFLIFIVGVLFFFAVLASINFGVEMFEFSTIPLSMETIFRGLNDGFDYDTMRYGGSFPVWNALFSFLFFVLATFILLNMFIAIIMDAYAEAKSAQSLESKFEETKQIFQIVWDSVLKWFGIKQGWSVTRFHAELVKEVNYDYEIFYWDDLLSFYKENATTQEDYDMHKLYLKNAFRDFGTADKEEAYSVSELSATSTDTSFVRD